MNWNFAVLMETALLEAKTSLREGNCGFGAVVARGAEIVAQAHDTEKTDCDPTAHAEITAVRLAAKQGRSLTDCALVCTHEPCPMCATAILWSGIGTIAYGYSIRDALRQGRRRIDLPCRELFQRAGQTIMIHESICPEQCAILYDQAVREEVRRLRGADEAALCAWSDQLSRKRAAWLERQLAAGIESGGDLLETAYRLLLKKLDIPAAEAPVIARSPEHLTFASRNFCPTLEACRILGLDSRRVCRLSTEAATTAMLQRLDSRLGFRRRYDTLRPYGEYCEETIFLRGQ